MDTSKDSGQSGRSGGYFDFLSAFRRKTRFDSTPSTETFIHEEIPSDEIEDGKPLAVLAYLPFLCFVSYFSARGKNSFAYEHGKQGVLLFLVEIVVIVCALFWKAAIFLAAVAAFTGIILALTGKIWKMPYIGQIADRFDEKK